MFILNNNKNKIFKSAIMSWYHQYSNNDEETTRTSGKIVDKKQNSGGGDIINPSNRTRDGLLVDPGAYNHRNGSENDNDYTNDDEPEIYVVKQKYGYFSYLFSIAQTLVLIIMMVQCGVAPFNVNPMIGPYPDALSTWGAKNTVLILEDDEWWRLISPIMLHAGIIHLACNIMVQLDTGAFFEREWGSLNWLIIYLVSAVGSTALSVVAMPDAISVGSSGAVMGLFGGKGAEVLCRCCEKESTEQDRVGHQVRKEQCAGVMCSVTVVLLFSFIPYVDWAAHLGTKNESYIELLSRHFVNFLIRFKIN